MGYLEAWLVKTASRPPDRPLVTLSYAQSLDGSLAAERGKPYPLSSPQSRQLTHQLRAAHDAIVVGIGTVLADDPQLNVRFAPGEHPQPVILDSKLRTPAKARVFSGEKKPWIFASSLAGQEAMQQLVGRGARLERQDTYGKVDLPAGLARLQEWGVSSVMVEGGGEVLASFLSQGLADRLVLTIAPQFLGGYRLPLLGKFPALVNVQVHLSGPDVILLAEFVKE
jgi:3,4-dihydroxy 2-butanone 4-phosphate synthase/GTP cyclohydrolase II